MVYNVIIWEGKKCKIFRYGDSNPGILRERQTGFGATNAGLLLYCLPHEFYEKLRCLPSRLMQT
eukprot:scaffold443_cov125-Cylindrotheca_fusiformis.AAC.13